MTKFKAISEEHYVILLYVVLSVITALFFRNKYISIVIGTFEVLLVIASILQKRGDNAFLRLVFFISTVIESAYFSTGTTDIKLYSFENLPGIRTYHILLICAFLLISTTLVNRRTDKTNKWIRRIVYFWGLECIVSIITCLIANDNGIRNTWGLIRLVIVDGYNSFFTVAVIAVSLNYLYSNKKFDEKIETLIICVLKGAVISAVILVFLQNIRVTEAGDKYLICPLILFWSPMLLLFYKKERKISYIIYGVISIILQMRYTVGIPGAWWITTAIIVVAFLAEGVKEIVFMRHTTAWNICILFLIVFVGMGVSIVLSTDNYSTQENYIIYKMRTAISILDFSKDPMVWLNGLGSSVGIRVEQIVNVIIEFMKNPMYILFGKGFGGTITHSWGIYNWNTTSAFSEVQIASKVYSNLHTGMAELMINFGLAGACIVLYLIKKMISAILGKRYNPWIIVGAVFLLFFYSYYWCMILCVVMMSYGIYIDDKTISTRAP